MLFRSTVKLPGTRASDSATEYRAPNIFFFFFFLLGTKSELGYSDISLFCRGRAVEANNRLVDAGARENPDLCVTQLSAVRNQTQSKARLFSQLPQILRPAIKISVLPSNRGDNTSRSVHRVHMSNATWPVPTVALDTMCCYELTRSHDTRDVADLGECACVS